MLRISCRRLASNYYITSIYYVLSRIFYNITGTKDAPIQQKYISVVRHYNSYTFPIHE